MTMSTGGAEVYRVTEDYRDAEGYQSVGTPGIGSKWVAVDYRFRFYYTTALRLEVEEIFSSIPSEYLMLRGF
ncbi:hypothetical protein B9Z55_025731 [Caenorhabditis nigoni]|uniref:Uncharacterized protein n=1 Tax=Caenorhabditis nigoni TaxID=1611254 RepID=A0A2G5T031_9PELO|nr:hypothetical protein B9Z55_025731 [Caenorhabditis nigoni]